MLHISHHFCFDLGYDVMSDHIYLAAL